MAAVVQRATLLTEERFVYTTVLQSDLQEFAVTMEEVEGLIDVVRRTREAEVSAVLKQDADGTFRVSLRSLGAVDVCAIAQRNGGGGHRFAAGFSSRDSADAIVGRLRAAVAEGS